MGMGGTVEVVNEVVDSYYRCRYHKSGVARQGSAKIFDQGPGRRVDGVAFICKEGK